MPSRYNNKTSRCIWIEDELIVKAHNLAKDLGYRSFSEFVRDLIREAVEVAEIAKLRPAKRMLLRQSITGKILAKILGR